MYYNNRPCAPTNISCAPTNVNCPPSNVSCAPLRNICAANETLGMAYVPMQKWGETFDLDKAYACATIFPDLVKPFWGRRA